MIKSKYVWKELSSDGLLKDPPKYGPHYNLEDVNGYDDGYDSANEAIIAFDKFVKENEWSKYDRLIMVEIYHHVEGTK